jgi:hypothetical protein
MTTYKLLTYLSLIVLISCNRQPSTTDNKMQVNNIEFPMKNPRLLTSLSHSDNSLDSLSRAMWTDPIMGHSQYYGASGLASFDKVNDFDVIAVETMADDWSKSFLLTLDSKRALVDFIEITDDYGDATQDEKGSETVVGTNTRTDFLINSVFVRTRIDKTIFNYKEPNELTEKDSIVEKFEIDKDGRFRKLTQDSVRIRE